MAKGKEKCPRRVTLSESVDKDTPQQEQEGEKSTPETSPNKQPKPALNAPYALGCCNDFLEEKDKGLFGCCIDVEKTKRSIVVLQRTNLLVQEFKSSDISRRNNQP